MNERAVLARLCQGPVSMQALAAELALDQEAVQASVASLRASGLPIVERDDREVTLTAPLQLLDANSILDAMNRQSRDLVQGITVFFETDSTQARADAAPTPHQGSHVFLAERQSAGQGRRGRSWASPLAANIYMSVSRRFAGKVGTLSGLSLVVGVAVAESLHAQGFNQVELKWPNDLFADGRKLGGILIALRSDGGPGSQSLIGIGLNVCMPATSALLIEQDWCDLSQLGGNGISRNELAASLLDHLLPALEQFGSDGLAGFMDRWQRLDALAGRAVRVLDGARVHEGVVLGITGSGALRVSAGGREQIFSSGDVSLRPA